MANALGQLGGEVGRWLDTHGRDVARAFEECRRADWLLRIAMTLGVDRRLIVLAAADCAGLAVKRTRQLDLRPARAVLAATKWATGECGPADAWAAGFGASHAAEEIAADAPLASEAALAAAAAAFACDPRADDSYYAQRAYAADAVDHAVRAYGLESNVGRQRCLDIARARITVTLLTSAVSRASSRPPPRVI
jgi:hypothetical protein